VQRSLIDDAVIATSKMLLLVPDKVWRQASLVSDSFASTYASELELAFLFASIADSQVMTLHDCTPCIHASAIVPDIRGSAHKHILLRSVMLHRLTFTVTLEPTTSTRMSLNIGSRAQQAMYPSSATLFP
jgi:hypothetical protein